MNPGSTPQKSHPQYGFTIIELMVTITLLSILLFAAVPSFSQWIRNNQLRSTAESLQNGIRLAKTQAIALNRQVVFSLTSATPANNISAASGGLNWTIQTIPRFAGDTTQTYIQGGNFGSSISGMQITTTPANTAVLCFNSVGQQLTLATPGTGTPCAAQKTTFTVERTTSVAGKDRPLQVNVSLSGQVRMCDPDRPNTSPDGCPP